VQCSVNCSTVPAGFRDLGSEVRGQRRDGGEEEGSLGMCDA
jgi:hypothetical protein